MAESRRKELSFNDLRRILSVRRYRGLHIQFGSSSQIGVLKKPRGLSFGISIQGPDLARERRIINCFADAGCIILRRSPKIVFNSQTRRALLLESSRSQFLSAMSALATLHS